MIWVDQMSLHECQLLFEQQSFGCLVFDLSILIELLSLYNCLLLNGASTKEWFSMMLTVGIVAKVLWRSDVGIQTTDLAALTSLDGKGLGVFLEARQYLYM